MAVVFDSTGNTGFDFATGATTTSTSNFSVGSGTNRAMVITLCYSNRSAVTTSVIWDSGTTNQNASAITGASGNSAGAAGNGRVELWGLVAPKTGNALTLKVTWTGSSDIYVDEASYTGVDQTGGTTTFANGTFSSGTSSQPSINVTSATGNAVVACLAVDNTNILTVSGTQLFLDNADSSLISAAANRDVGAATVTMSSTPNNDWGMAGVNVVAAGTAGNVPYQPYFQQFLASKRKSVGWSPLMDPRRKIWRPERGILVSKRRVA